MAVYSHGFRPTAAYPTNAQPFSRLRLLNFRVVSCSSFADADPPENLAMPAETSAGWVSDEFCSFPQDLIIEFPAAAVVESLQLIVHKYFIPSIVDFFLIQNDAQSEMGVSNTDLQQVAQFRFPDSETETWDNEPLVKDVRFQPPLVARFLQISCHRFQPNPYNLFDQVGIFSVGFFGEQSDSAAGETSVIRHSVVPYIPHPMTVQVVPQRFYRETDYIPHRLKRQRPPFFPFFPFPQKSFNPLRGRPEMMPMVRLRSRDVNVAQLLVRLENFKQSAIQNDDFQTAACTKTIIDDLTKIEDKVGELETKKDEAIEEEDYEQAEEHKHNVFELTVSALKHLRTNRFGHFFEKEQLKELESSLRKRKLRPSANRGTETSAPSGERSAKATFTSNTQARPVVSPERPIRPNGSSYVYNDSGSQSFGRFQSSKKDMVPETSEQQMRRQGAEPGDNEKPKKSNQNHSSSFHYALEVFGEEVVDLVCSPAFASRVHGLERVNAVLEKNIEKNNLMIPILIRATVVLLDSMLKEDAVIVQLTAHLILKLLNDVVPTYPESKVEVPGILAVALPFALSRLGSTNRRISQILMPFVIELALLAVIKALPVVPQVCCDSLKPTAQTRYSVGRVRIVQDLLNCLAIGESSGLTLELLVQFSLSAMEHHDPEVRRGGEKVIIWLYDRDPPLSFRLTNPASDRKAAYQESIRSQLPTPPQQNDEKGPRDFKYRRLFQVLAEIDANNRKNVPPTEARLHSPALAPEHFPFYSKLNKRSLTPGAGTAGVGEANGSPGSLVVADHNVELAEARSHIRIVLGRNHGTPSPAADLNRVRSNDTFSKEKTPSIHDESDTISHTHEIPVVQTFSRTASPASVISHNPSSVTPPVTPLVTPLVTPPLSVEAAAREFIPLRKEGKNWKYLRVLAEMLESEGFWLAENTGFGKDKTKWPRNLVQACPFCGKPDIVEKLNYHLYQECPMLKKCSLCDNKILIPDLTKHQLKKCMKKIEVEACPKCHLAVPKKKLAKHVKANQCADPGKETNATVCPLCGELVEHSDDGWVHHLLNKDYGCEKNPRREKALKWTDHLAHKDSSGSLVKITGNK